MGQSAILVSGPAGRENHAPVDERGSADRSDPRQGVTGAGREVADKKNTPAAPVAKNFHTGYFDAMENEKNVRHETVPGHPYI
jgi:hypothetical protein